MKKITVVNSDHQKEIYPIKFVICYGDYVGLCDICKAKFCCYTGELPIQFSGDVTHNYGKTIELKIFGDKKNAIRYDYETHNNYYDQNWM